MFIKMSWRKEKMKRNAGCAVMIILGMLLAGRGNHTAAESTEMPEPDISSQEKNISMAAPADLGAIRQIHMENPSWNTTVQRNRPLWRHR